MIATLQDVKMTTEQEKEFIAALKRIIESYGYDA